MEINKDFPANDTNYSFRLKNQIKYIVIHYVGALGSAKNNAVYFCEREFIGSSAHYFVGHESEGGAVYESVNPAYRAWHCGSETGKYKNDCRNENSIGIELCCHQDSAGKWYFDNITKKNAAMLVRILMKKYCVTPDRVIRHFDVTGKNCPAPFVENEEAWQDFKRRISIVEAEDVEEIVSGLCERGIVIDTEGMKEEMNKDRDSRLYWLARKTLQYIREEE